MCRRQDRLTRIDVSHTQFGSFSVYRCTATGLAWLQDQHGHFHSAHPNIHHSGSIRGMKKKGFWGRSDRTAKCRGYIHNIDLTAVRTDLDALAAEYCGCGGKHPAYETKTFAGKRRITYAEYRSLIMFERQ